MYPTPLKIAHDLLIISPSKKFHKKVINLFFLLPGDVHRAVLCRGGHEPAAGDRQPGQLGAAVAVVDAVGAVD